MWEPRGTTLVRKWEPPRAYKARGSQRRFRRGCREVNATMNHTELVAIAGQLRRTADLIDMKPECDHPRRCGTRAEHALMVTKDWSVPLTAEVGPRPKGDHGDPTATAGLNQPDALALEHGHLVAELQVAWRAAADLGGHIIGATTTAKIVNERAGIGWCDGPCGRYCDGSAANRLRAGKCDACRQRARRAAKAGVGTVVGRG